MIRANILAEVCKPVKKATTAVVLTHNIDFLFVQSILLSRLHSIGHPKLTIFADASCSTSSYNQQFELLSGLGQRYRVVPLDLGNGRRFHPKAIFLAGPDGASLAIGSGNLTHGGWSCRQRDLGHLRISRRRRTGSRSLPRVSADNFSVRSGFGCDPRLGDGSFHTGQLG